MRTRKRLLLYWYRGEIPESPSERLRENYEFFCEQLAATDLANVYQGVSKLQIVDVALTLGQDNPQLIFKSLNSTGMDLTQADLIRNFVLMAQDEATQTRLYLEQWQPMEVVFGARYGIEFDKFMRDYLALELKPSKQVRSDQIYTQFRQYFEAEVSQGRSVEAILGRIRRFGGYYARFGLGKETDAKLMEALRRVRGLAEVASPLVMHLYACHDDAKTLTSEEFVEAMELIESYVFRRSACDMQTRSLWQIFASLAYRIRFDDPLTSMKVALARQGKGRRFPTDVEFRQSLVSRDVYDMRNCHYLLDRLENDSKEKIDTDDFTIEHVMPQNEDLRKEWREMLGTEWKEIQGTWLHRLGNVTLTAYNPEYSDRSFRGCEGHSETRERCDTTVAVACPGNSHTSCGKDRRRSESLSRWPRRRYLDQPQVAQAQHHHCRNHPAHCVNLRLEANRCSPIGSLTVQENDRTAQRCPFSVLDANGSLHSLRAYQIRADILCDRKIGRVFSSDSP